MLCCARMKLEIENMNQNGITIVPRMLAGRRCFVVRFRWVDPALWQRLGHQVPQMTPFASAGETGIRHCPGCGASLEEWAERNALEYDEILTRVVD
jgi:hypothetical protein